MARLFSRVFSACFLIALCSCSTPFKSSMLGSGIGALAGGAVGAIANGGYHGANRPQNMALGASVGLLVGASLGYLSHQYVEGREQDLQENGKNGTSATPFYPGTNPNEPMLNPPKIESRYVEDQVRGNVYVPAHWEYQIVEPAKWSK